MNVLITGSTGTLGRHLARAALSSGYAVRVQSRRLPPGGGAEVSHSWAQADLVSGEGVREAVGGMDAVIHAASDPRRPQAVDVVGTKRLVEAARQADVGHLIYVSIVGVDKLPYAYYRAKMEAEGLVVASGLPFSILRATQFHAFVDRLIASAARIPFVLPLPTDFRVQRVAADEVAARLVRALGAGPAGRLPDFGGPEVMTLEAAARVWKRVSEVHKPVAPLPLVGGLAAGFRAGHNTAPEGELGSVRWETWLRARTADGTELP